MLFNSYEFIFIFLPVTFFIYFYYVYQKFNYDLDALINSFQGVEIIDLSDLSIPYTLILEGEHLNLEGRKYYSNYLSNLFNKRFEND